MPPLDPGLFFFLVLILVLLGFLLIVGLFAFIQHARDRAATLLLERERLEAQLTLKRELIQRNLPPHELEQAVKLLKLDETPAATPPAPARTEQQLEAEILERLALLDGMTAADLEQVFPLVRAADRDTKEAALALMENLAENEPDAELVLASVRSLCRPADRPRADGKSLELSEHFTR